MDCDWTSEPNKTFPPGDTFGIVFHHSNRNPQTPSDTGSIPTRFQELFYPEKEFQMLAPRSFSNLFLFLLILALVFPLETLIFQTP